MLRREFSFSRLTALALHYHLMRSLVLHSSYQPNMFTQSLCLFAKAKHCAPRVLCALALNLPIAQAGDIGLDIRSQDDGPSDGLISGTINAGSSSESSFAYGVYLENATVSGGVAAGSQISASNNSHIYSATGIDIGGNASLGDVKGTITINASGMSNGTGIFLHDGGSCGTFSGSLELNVNSGTSYGYVVGKTVSSGSVGLWNAKTSNSQDFDVDWSQANISMSTNTGTSYGLYIQGDANHPTSAIGGTIKAHNSGGSATAIYCYGTSNTLQFQNGAVVSATQGTGSNIKLGTAISNYKGITMESVSSSTSEGFITIQGNISASTKYDLSILSGRYQLEADTIYAKNFNLGSSVDSTLTQVTIVGNTELHADTINFTLSSDGLTQIVIAAAGSLDLSQVTTINVLIDSADTSLATINNLGGSSSFDGFKLIDGNVIFGEDMPEMIVTDENGQNYEVVYDATGGITIQEFQVAPEPSTASLSLIALALLLRSRKRAKMRHTI